MEVSFSISSSSSQGSNDSMSFQESVDSNDSLANINLQHPAQQLIQRANPVGEGLVEPNDRRQRVIENIEVLERQPQGLRFQGNQVIGQQQAQAARNHQAPQAQNVLALNENNRINNLDNLFDEVMRIAGENRQNNNGINNDEINNNRIDNRFNNDAGWVPPQHLMIPNLAQDENHIPRGLLLRPLPPPDPIPRNAINQIFRPTNHLNSSIRQNIDELEQLLSRMIHSSDDSALRFATRLDVVISQLRRGLNLPQTNEPPSREYLQPDTARVLIGNRINALQQQLHIRPSGRALQAHVAVVERDDSDPVTHAFNQLVRVYSQLSLLNAAPVNRSS